MSDSKSGKIIFKAPEGLDLEGKEKGDALEFVGEVRIEEDGKLCLKRINGIELSGYDEKPKPAKSFAEAVTGDYSED